MTRVILLAFLVLGCGTSKFDAQKEGGVRLEYALAEEPPAGNPSPDKLLDDIVKVIARRLQQLGESKYGVKRQGMRILVDLPRFDDPGRLDRVKRIIATSARLEFRIVDERGTEKLFTGIADMLPADGTVRLLSENVMVDWRIVTSYYLEANDDPTTGRSGRDILKEFMKTVAVPKDRAIGFEKRNAVDETGAPTSAVAWRTYYLERTAGLTGAYIVNAEVLVDEQTGRPYVSLDFGEAGGKIFEELTAKNVKHRMAIELDDTVQSAPLIMERIPGGRCRITLGTDGSNDAVWQMATDLVVVLRAGALPAPIEPTREELIQPR